MGGKSFLKSNLEVLRVVGMTEINAKWHVKGTDTFQDYVSDSDANFEAEDQQGESEDQNYIPQKAVQGWLVAIGL